MIQKTYSLRLYPNRTQMKGIRNHCGAARFAYNKALEKKIKAYEEGKKLSWIDLCNELPLMKKQYPWMEEITAQSLQASIKNLDRAYQHFFKKKKGFPKFKSRKQGRQSYHYPQGVKVNSGRHRIYLPKIGWVRYRDDRKIDGPIKTVTIVKTATDKYFGQVLVGLPLEVPEKPPVEESRTCGIDVGIHEFAVLSDGRRIPNPGFLKEDLRKLKRAHRRVSRKMKGSCNRRKEVQKLARVHEKIANRRNNFLHQASASIVHDSQVNSWVIEDLNIRGMVKNRRLSRSIMDAGWSEFHRQLKYKCLWNGKNLIQIGRFMPTSKQCGCGTLNETLSLKERSWVCSSCGAVNDRDLLAARNIKKFGLNTGGNPGIDASGDHVQSGGSMNEEVPYLS